MDPSRRCQQAHAPNIGAPPPGDDELKELLATNRVQQPICQRTSERIRKRNEAAKSKCKSTCQSSPPNSTTRQGKAKPKAKATSMTKSKTPAANPDVRTIKRLRTREKERLHHYNLTLDVFQLHQEIRQYETLRAVLRTRALLDQKAKAEALMRSVSHFYKTFRHGFNTSNTIQRAPIALQGPYDQGQCLRTIMDADLVIGPFRGVEVLIDQCVRYADYLLCRNFELVSADIIDINHRPIVKTIGDCTFRLTQRSVQELFPHVLHQEATVQRMLGLQMRFHCSIDFFFNAKWLISRLEVRMEFFLALSQVFKDPKEFLALMRRAKITDDFFLGDLPYRRGKSAAASVRAASSSQQL